jgi:hypothetical protein
VAFWRKIDTRIWNDEKFRSLSDQGKLLFLYILTHPNMTCLGAMRSTLDGLSAELGWEGGATRGATYALVENGMLVVDEFAHYVGAPHWFKYNPPERPLGLEKLWTGALDRVPECPSKIEQIVRAIECLDGLSEKMRTAIGGGTRRAMVGATRGATRGVPPFKETEPEPEPEKDQTTLSFAFANGDGSKDSPTQQPEAEPQVPTPAATRKRGNGHSRAKVPKGEADTTPLPFSIPAALETLTSRCTRVVLPRPFEGKWVGIMAKLIRSHPDLKVWELVGDWLAAGGVAYMSFIGLDCIRKNLDTWVPVSEQWEREGRKPLTRKTGAAGRGPAWDAA